MNPSKGAVRVQEVIGILCKLLTATGLDSVPTPEVFRRAKFNCGPEAEDPFWRLLASLLKTSQTISVDASPELPGGLASDHRRCVAVALWQSGFCTDWTRRVGGGEEGSPCSRELLLALGWLLATGTLEAMLARRAQQLDPTGLDPPEVTPVTQHGAQMDRPSLRRLQWLIGSLRFQRRSLLSMQEERSKLMHMVLSGTLPHSSSRFISDSNSALQEDCDRMRDLCHLLESYVHWKQTETLFWAWMDSVVERHATDQREACLAEVSANRGGAICHHGNRGLEHFNSMLLGLHTMQEERGPRRERDEPRHRRGREDKLPVGRHRGTSPGRWQAAPLAAPLGYRLRLQGETGPPNCRFPTEKPRDGAPLAGKLQASEASRLLLLTESSFLERRDRCRTANRTQLQEMIGRLQDLVLIAPEVTLNQRDQAIKST